MNTIRRIAVVTVVALLAQKEEKVAVVVDHDKPADEAIQVPFETLK
jgi:hypothetical protein